MRRYVVAGCCLWIYLLVCTSCRVGSFTTMKKNTEWFVPRIFGALLDACLSYVYEKHCQWYKCCNVTFYVDRYPIRLDMEVYLTPDNLPVYIFHTSSSPCNKPYVSPAHQNYEISKAHISKTFESIQTNT